jgi:hypothetical protein
VCDWLVAASDVDSLSRHSIAPRPTPSPSGFHRRRQPATWSPSFNFNPAGIWHHRVIIHPHRGRATGSCGAVARENDLPLPLCVLTDWIGTVKGSGQIRKSTYFGPRAETPGLNVPASLVGDPKSPVAMKLFRSQGCPSGSGYPAAAQSD